MLKSRELEDSKMTIKIENSLSIKKIFKLSSLNQLALIIIHVLCLLLLTHNTYATDDLNEFPHNSSSTSISNVEGFSDISLSNTNLNSNNLNNNLETKKYLKADQAFSYIVTQDNNTVTIDFIIAPKYYLYVERFDFKANNNEILDIILPEGIEHDDEYMGLSHILYNDASIKLQFKNIQSNATITMRYQGCTEGMCYPPIFKDITVQALDNNNDTKTKELNTETSKNNFSSKVIENNSFQKIEPTSDSHKLYNEIKTKNIFLGLLAFIAFGVLLGFTPCVFPMYPIWASIILGNRDKTPKTAFIYSFFYAQGIAITYMLIGISIAAIGAKLQSYLQSPYFLIPLSALFIVLALSMFGLFDIALPSKFTNKLNDKSSKIQGGSVIGVFLMGVISAIVASPCTTAPLAGALMFIIQDGSMLKGGLYLYFLGLGFCSPLFILGILGQKFMPKNGTWMITIKNICGYILLIVPIFILGNTVSKEIIVFYSSAILFIFISFIFIKLISFKKMISTTVKSTIISSAFILSIINSYIIINNQSVDEQVNSLNQFITVNSIEELHIFLQNNDKVLLDVRADWCTSCKEYETKVFTNQVIIDKFKEYQLLKLDITETNDLKEIILDKYKIVGAPTIIIFNKTSETQRINGFYVAEELIKFL
jgi:thiol:disulfide interchange protein DsbD